MKTYPESSAKAKNVYNEKITLSSPQFVAKTPLPLPSASNFCRAAETHTFGGIPLKTVAKLNENSSRQAVSSFAESSNKVALLPSKHFHFDVASCSNDFYDDVEIPDSGYVNGRNFVNLHSGYVNERNFVNPKYDESGIYSQVV